MPLAIPPELKKITPFVRRAEELDKDKTSPESRLVAYYCRQYAVHVGIPLSSSSPGAKTCLGHLLETLEKEKPAMDNFTRDEAAFLCRKFAVSVFDKADGIDRAGAATNDTAKIFYAAASFLEILKQFYNDNDTSDEVVEDKRRIIYAKWKATEILKAFKEGRQPTPGGYGESNMNEIVDDTVEDGKETEKKMDAPTRVVTVANDDDDDDDNGDDRVAANKFDLNPPKAPNTTMPPLNSSNVQPDSGSIFQQQQNNELADEQGTEVKLGPPPAYPGEDSNYIESFNLPPPVESKPLQPLPPPASSFNNNDNDAYSTKPMPQKPATPKTGGMGLFGFVNNKKSVGKASKAQIADATELTRFALAALEDKDSELAAERLQQALQALGR